MKKILVLGGSGFIGTKLVEKLSTNTEFQITATYYQHHLQVPRAKWMQMNVINHGVLQQLLEKTSPEVIINCVAMSGVDACEQDEVLCTTVNTDPSTIIVEYCQQHPKVKYILFSSSQVFEGSRGKYKEDDIPCPINKYGKSKLQAELITRNLPYYAIIRPCFVFGVPLPFQHGNIFYYIYKSLQAGKEFRAYSDMIRSPCYVQDVVKVVEQVINMNKQGIFHAPGEAISIYNFGVRIASFFHLNEHLLTAEVSQGKEPEYRARNTSLDSSRTEQELMIAPTPLPAAFEEIKRALQ